MTITKDVEKALSSLRGADLVRVVAELREVIHQHAPQRGMPIDLVRWIPLDRVTPNDYNPNSVARLEMGLLYTSIKHDGYTQPVVTIYDPERDLYVIVDGFHRYYTMKTNRDIYDACNGCLPCVVIEKNINERMAATVRHNRARGKHSVQGMSNMVFQMLENGMSDAEVCNELGLQPEELVRLKHITGFSKLFEDVQFGEAWMTERMIKIRNSYQQAHAAGQTVPSDPTYAGGGVLKSPPRGRKKAPGKAPGKAAAPAAGGPVRLRKGGHAKAQS